MWGGVGLLETWHRLWTRVAKYNGTDFPIAVLPDVDENPMALRIPSCFLPAWWPQTCHSLADSRGPTYPLMRRQGGAPDVFHDALPRVGRSTPVLRICALVQELVAGAFHHVRNYLTVSCLLKCCAKADILKVSCFVQSPKGAKEQGDKV